MKDVTKDVMSIATLFVMVAFAALLIHNASGTVQVVNSVGNTFVSLLKTVSMQS